MKTILHEGGTLVPTRKKCISMTRAEKLVKKKLVKKAGKMKNAKVYSLAKNGNTHGNEA